MENALKKDWRRSIPLILFDIVCGLMLVLWPGKMTDIANWILGILLIIGGAVSVITYFRDDALTSSQGRNLTSGLMLVAIGVIMLIFPDIIRGLLPVVIGLILFAGGLSRLQDAVDARRLSQGRWWLALLIMGLVGVGFGIYCILRHNDVLLALAQIVGIFLLVEAALNGATVLITRKKVDEKSKEKA